MSSASSSARWMALTVVSMLTTTPFFSPREGWLPMPMISKPPSGLTSATMAAIFEVPTSSPTSRFLLSRALPMFRIRSLFCPPALRSRGRLEVWHAHGEAVAVAQIHVLDAAPEAPDRAVVGAHEAREARFHLLAPELQREPVVEPELPRAARRHAHLHRGRAYRFQAAHEIAVLDGDLARHSLRSEEQGKLSALLAGEDLAVRIH